MRKILFSFLIVSIFFGCATLSPNYTMEISPLMIQNNIAKQFPVKKRYTLGILELQEPIVGLKEGSDRMQTGINFAYKPQFFSSLTGKINISGKIFYNKEKKAFYLLEPKIDKLQFNNTSIPSLISNDLKGIMGGVVNAIFKEFPVYELTSETLSSRIMQKTVKNAQVKDGKLLVTFGVPEFK